jgi:hypothetical protein
LPSTPRRRIEGEGGWIIFGASERLGFLDGDTLRVLQSASILGSSFTVIELSTVTGSTAAAYPNGWRRRLRQES